MKIKYNFTVALFSFAEVFLIYKKDGKYRANLKPLNRIIDTFNDFSENLEIVLNSEGEGVNNNGKWTGLIGHLQRKEIDLVLWPMSFSMLPELPPFNFTPALGSNAYKILSFYKKGNKMIDIITSISIVPLNVIIFILILMIIIAFLIVINENIHSNISTPNREYITDIKNSNFKMWHTKGFKIFAFRLKEMIWLMYSIFWRQSSFKKRQIFSRALVIFFVILIFFIIAYFSSLFSTNLVVSIKPFVPDTFEDIFDPRFAKHKIIIRKTSLLARLVVAERSESLKRLKKRLLNDGIENSLIDDKFDAFWKFNDVVENPLLALISTNLIFGAKKFIQTLEQFPEINISKDSLYPNLLTIIATNRNKHFEDAYTILCFAINVWFEAGIIDVTLKAIETEWAKNYNPIEKSSEEKYNNIKFENIKLFILLQSITYMDKKTYKRKHFFITGLAHLEKTN